MDITPIINALIVLLAAVITGVIVPKVKLFLQAKLNSEQYTLLLEVVDTLVLSAEQLYGDGNGKKKLQYVKLKLEEKGFIFDPDVVEAAVYRHFVLNQDQVNEEEY